jgi:hypothetical protein
MAELSPASSCVGNELLRDLARMGASTLCRYGRLSQLGGASSAKRLCHAKVGGISGAENNLDLGRRFAGKLLKSAQKGKVRSDGRSHAPIGEYNRLTIHRDLL